VLDLRLTQELIDEGLAREVVSKVQNMRKNAGFELTDRIKLEYKADEKVAAAIERFKEYIASETLAVSVGRNEAGGEGFETWDINGYPAELKVSKQ